MVQAAKEDLLRAGCPECSAQAIEHLLDEERFHDALHKIRNCSSSPAHPIRISTTGEERMRFLLISCRASLRRNYHDEVMIRNSSDDKPPTEGRGHYLFEEELS